MIKAITTAFCLFLVANSIAQNPKTEIEKIEALIAYVATIDGTLIRNGSEYSSADAASHLKLKLSKAGNRVKTAKDFIDYIGSKSSVSGKPYEVKFKNGNTILLRDLLYNQLRKIEK